LTETEKQMKQREHQEDLQRLRGFRPIDDDFMRGLFKNNTPLAEMVLRIIMQKPDLRIEEPIETQKDMKRVTGARSVCLDVYATDEESKKYDVEIQRADLGAGEHRARYNSSIMDVENLDAGQDFDELPDTYTIFITEKDFFGEGKPLYPIRSMNLATGKPFEDGRYILYVNGEYRGDDDIGKLMHDFNCSDPDDMNYSLLADRSRYLKENPEGVKEMCKVMEDLRVESEKKGAEKKARETAKNLYTMGLDVDKIAVAVGYAGDIVRKWLGLATA